MATVGRRLNPDKGSASSERPKTGSFARLVANAVIAGVLMTTPNFINNNGGNVAMAEKMKITLTPEQEKKLEKMGKECVGLFLNFIKTGDVKYFEEFDKVRRTEVGEKRADYYLIFNKSFESALKAQAKNDPGLKAFVGAYENKYDKLRAKDFFNTVNDMFAVSDANEAEKKYGNELVKSFTGMVTWRLAAYAAEVSLEVFTPEKSMEALSEMERVAEIQLLGVAIINYENFITTYDKQIAKKFEARKDLAELWDIYEKGAGEENAAMRDLVEDVYGCIDMISSKGKAKAEKEYGTDFVAAATAVVKLTPVKTEVVPEKTEYTDEELIGLFNTGDIKTIAAYLDLYEHPISAVGKKAKKEKSDRIKSVQKLLNEVIIPDKEFQAFLKKEGSFKKLKGTKIKTNGTQKSIHNYAIAINYFLKEKANDIEFKGVLADAGINPAEIKKNAQVTPAMLSALAVYLGKVEKVNMPAPLEEQVAKLSAPDRKFYDENIKPWLDEKTEYTVLNLQDMLDYLINEVRNGKLKTPPTTKQLDAKMNYFETNGYMQRTAYLVMKPSELAKAIVSGEGIADALGMFIIGQKTITTSTKPKIEGARIRTAELILDTFIQNIDDYIPPEFIEGLKADLSKDELKTMDVLLKKEGIPVNSAYEKDEVYAVKAIQTLLFHYARKDEGFNTALEELGIAYSDLKADGQFDEQTAKALAAFISYRKGTWEKEKESLIKAKAPEEKPKSEKKPKEGKPKEKPEPGKPVLKFY